MERPLVVLIEMDEVTLELYARELGKSFTVQAFTDIDAALPCLKQPGTRAVIIEPEVQSGKGWELLKLLQQELSVPVIVCSTREPADAKMPYRAARYLTKPVLPVTLREKTLEVLSN